MLLLNLKKQSVPIIPPKDALYPTFDLLVSGQPIQCVI